MTHWLKNQAAAAGLDNIAGVVLVSAKTGWGLDRLMDRIVKLCTLQRWQNNKVASQ